MDLSLGNINNFVSEFRCLFLESYMSLDQECKPITVTTLVQRPENEFSTFLSTLIAPFQISIMLKIKIIHQLI